ncbi:MAG: metallophosphoesterase [Clostridia bacterium]|nr:metallophosphoesterase [Clostridia bacterium]
MDIYAISDLHLSFSEDKPMDIFGACWEGHWQKICDDWKSKVKDDDVVIIAGDISWAMTLENALLDIAEIAKLPGKKVIIKGNHDYWWSSVSKIRKVLPQDFFVIQNDAIKFGNTVICGTRLWNLTNPTLADKKINEREKIRLELSLDSAMKLKQDGDSVLVICHYPPFDATLGDSDYTAIIEKYGVEAVVYGHLHGKDCRAVKYMEKNSVKYYLTSCDQIDNKLVKIRCADLEKVDINS